MAWKQGVRAVTNNQGSCADWLRLTERFDDAEEPMFGQVVKEEKSD